MYLWPASPSTPDLHYRHKPCPGPCGFSRPSAPFLLSCFFISFPSSVLSLLSSCAPHPHVSLIEHFFSCFFFFFFLSVFQSCSCGPPALHVLRVKQGILLNQVCWRNMRAGGATGTGVKNTDLFHLFSSYTKLRVLLHCFCCLHNDDKHLNLEWFKNDTITGCSLILIK